MGKYFGTDGVRGVANKDLTAELAFKIGKAVGYNFRKKNGETNILIGKDTRLSGDMLESALISGLCSVGSNAIKVGIVPTPGVAYLTRYFKADAGIVISASHNPMEFNGIKVIDKNGHKLEEKVEENIESLIDDFDLDYTIEDHQIGIVKEEYDSIENYIKYISETIGTRLDGIKIAMDCSEGAASYCGPEVFRKLGAELVVIHNNPNGININEKCGSTHLDEIREVTVANRCDIGLAFDGDTDRCLAVDENGEVVNGDFIMMILGKYLKDRGKLAENTIVATIMSNMGLFIACEEKGILVDRTQVGDKYVLETMRKEKKNLGGEQSGHIILLDYNTTGDGILTGLFLASILKETGDKLSDLKNIMKELPQVLINVKVDNSEKYIFEENIQIVEKIKSVERKLGKSGRVLVRPSGTEPLIRVMLEGIDKEEITIMAEEIVEEIKLKSKLN